MKRYNPYKDLSKKEWIKAIAFLLVFFGIVFLVVKIATKPKPVATYDQVYDLLTLRGYKVEDLTDSFNKKTAGVLNNLTVNQDDLTYEFFVFENDKKAIRSYDILNEAITNIKLTTGGVETNAYHGNFIYRTLLYDGKYYYLVRVGNTLAYATGSEKNKSEIIYIMSEIGYIQ